jgi:16S rRNA (adenine1518-N6/adenine1519-N6)-dimethyltransferase
MSDVRATNKSLGQHWLFDVVILSDIADCADIVAEDTVLEIGPGLGTLTNTLVKRAKQVIAVEFDTALARDLPKQVTAKNLEIVEQDILQFNFARLPKKYKVVANIPYYLTSNLIRIMSEAENAPERAVLLVQKEVAERVAAKPGAMSILSVTAQFYWQVSLGSVVHAIAFTPPPKIDSQILILERRERTLLLNDADIKLFFRLVKAGFSQRRKTLLNSLSAGLRVDKEHIKSLCVVATIDVGRRAQSLSLDEWMLLYNAYTELESTT